MGARKRQANEPGGRSVRHVVKVTVPQEGELLRRAGAAKVTVPRLLVESALAGGSMTRAEADGLRAELAVIRRLLANVANNANQIAVRLHSQESSPTVEQVTGLAKLNRDAVSRIEAALDAVTG